MGTFDSHYDAPEKILQEGENVELLFDRLTSTTGRVSWKIPPPADGCSSENQAYNGIVVVLNTVANKPSNRPDDGVRYLGDPTADPDLHSGDVLDGALVIGAYYDDKTTTEFTVTDLTEGAAYFITAHAVDAQNRYHRLGASAYSLPLQLNERGEDTAAFQEITLSNSGADIVGTDSTGLVIGNIYDFCLTVDDKEYNIEIDGADAQTYDDLLAEINKQIELLGNPFQGPLAPNTNGYYYNLTTGQLFQWDGTQHVELPVTNHPSEPNDVDPGEYWLDTDSGVNELNRYDGNITVAQTHVDYDGISPNGSFVGGTGYVVADTITLSDGSVITVDAVAAGVVTDFTVTSVGATLTPVGLELTQTSTSGVGTGFTLTPGTANIDPLTLTWVLQTPQLETGYDVTNPPCDVYWYNDGPCEMWKWNGTTWCKKQPVFVQETDPSDPENLACGTFWLDGDGQLFTWSIIDGCGQWVQVEAISWDTRPDQLPNGTYWFNDSTNEVNLRVGGAWVVQTAAFVQEEEPLTNIVGSIWFVPSTEQLFVLDATATWVEEPVLIYSTDPTDIESCDLWFNTITEELLVWDAVNNEWDQVAQFFDQVEDPSEPKALTVGTIWVRSSDNTYYEWDGGEFVQIANESLVVWPSDPTQILAGTIWYQTTTNTYFVWDGSMWNVIDPIEQPEDPTVPAVGDFWFNTTTNILSIWNGTMWVAVAYSSASLAPSVGDVWYDTINEDLLTWNGSAWVPATPLVIATLNETEPSADLCEPTSNIVFKRTAEGSHASVQIGTATVPTGQIVYPMISYNFKGNLFNALGATALLQAPVSGGDGLESIPMYEQEGVGTDGSADERRELADSLRKQLGYPTVEVELTKKQMDEAIQSALEEFRLRSSGAYRRVYFFLDLQPGKQKYVLTNKAVGFNKIVNVMGMWRVTSAFQSTAYASGVYGQTVLQHLYHMGTFDLVSYHIVSDYIEQLEQLFATRVTFTWHEGTRELNVFQTTYRPERVLVDAMIERTEQDLLTDRLTKNWIERWALAQAQLTLSEIRGKYATLPGAGGGVALNAADLEEKARFNMEQCFQDLDNFVVNDIENLGIGSEFIIG